MTPPHLAFLIVCISCKTSCNVLSHFHWGLGQFVGGWGLLKFRGIVKKRASQDFRSPDVVFSVTVSMFFQHPMWVISW